MYASVSGPSLGHSSLGAWSGLGQDEGSAQLAAAVLGRSGLVPIIDSWAGKSLTEKLASGYAAAKASLLKYTSTLTFDPLAAEDLLHEIQAWRDRNAKVIDEMMLDPSAHSLPDQIALKFGPKKAQQFIIAGYAEAVRGLAPWLSGDIAANFKDDPTITEAWVAADANDRLVTLASIVKMDQDGDLEKVFLPEQYAAGQPAASGLGFFTAMVGLIGPVLTVVLVSVIFLGTVALLFMFVDSMTQTILNNRNMTARCEDAEKRGDKKMIELCIKLAGEAKAKRSSVEELAGKVFKYALIGGVVYTLAVIVLPKLTERAMEKAPA